MEYSKLELSGGNRGCMVPASRTVQEHRGLQRLGERWSHRKTLLGESSLGEASPQLQHPCASESEGIHHPYHHYVPQRCYDGNPQQDGIIGGARRLLGLAMAVGHRVDVARGVKQGVFGTEVLIG